MRVQSDHESASRPGPDGLAALATSAAGVVQPGLTLRQRSRHGPAGARERPRLPTVGPAPSRIPPHAEPCHAGPVRQRPLDITPDLMLRAYRAGIFPMAEARDANRLHWLDPDPRGVLPLDAFHLPRRLMRTVLHGPFSVTADADFAGVIGGCAAPAPGREGTWINAEIESLFRALHRMGHAHSIEVRQDGHLVGGLYGVRVGAAFFGESMFSRARDASKVALVHLVARLRLGGAVLLDTQFLTGHLAQFGALEMPRTDYKALLARAVDLPLDWIAVPDPALLEAAIRDLRPGAGAG